MAPVHSTLATASQSQDSQPRLETPSHADSAPQAEIARLKRTLAKLEEEKERLIAKNSFKDSTDAVKGLVSLGRGFRRLVSLFDEPRTLIHALDKRAEEGELTDDEEEGTVSRPKYLDMSSMPIEKLKEDQAYRGYKAFAACMPEVFTYLERADIMPSDINALYKVIKESGDKARSDDTATLKGHVTYWIQSALPGAPDAAIVHLISHPKSKDERGLQNDATAELLSSIDWDWSDITIRQKIKDRDPAYQITCDEYPRFLFSMKEHDPRDIEKTLFRGPLIVRAFLCIFRSPSSAMDFGLEDLIENDDFQALFSNMPPHKRRRMSKHPTKSSVSTILGMKAVTGRSIAYVCVQVHFALNDIASWTKEPDPFDYETFYNRIVDYFERPPGERSEAKVKALLQWWNTTIFSQTRPKESAVPATTGSIAKLAAQRLAAEMAS